jgi:phosphomannomutase
VSTQNEDALLARAHAFLADDPDPDTRRELQALLDARDFPALVERFADRLTFGTAGLRGRIGAGDSCMNVRVVAQATAGVCAHLRAAVPDAANRGVCIGFDGRTKSREFAEEAARIVTGAGIAVHLFDDVVSTPLLAFSVLQRRAAAGIMVTASHNPKDDNGYKVYWENGAQIVPPHDVAIEAEIAKVTSVLALPRLPLPAARKAGLLRGCSDLEERYFAALSELVGREAEPSTLRIAYTALHGVGERFTRRALADAGFSAVASVAAQAKPDAAFPTVAFPNPEEKGAMDLVLELATQTQADLVLANDPDADRLAVAVRARDGRFAQLTGNDVGVLLADHLLREARQDGKNLVLSSLVSTPLLARIAAAHGARWEQTLTGFKWIASRAIELAASEGLRMVLGCEEALGYTAGSVVRDKDGVSSAAIVARMAAQHARRGHSLLDALEALQRAHGLFRSRPVSITLRGAEGMQRMREVMAHLRRTTAPRLAGCAVLERTDLALGAWGLPRSDVLVYALEGGHRIAIRPSGTEPKIKLYIDACTQVAGDESIQHATSRVDAIAEALRADFMQHAGL